ncbi:MAG TPA: GntR family transcriptional regulator [Solirubrobacteraceae bacterium]|jgi:DNA-binding GntR family transcriptional regulator|nr:GntR family transcriptional regulator [Solirubrobacteraceae bacterium]
MTVVGVDELTAELQGLILSGAVPTGSWLRQERLATRFGVSRTPVREALRVLAARGLIELHANRGALVCGPSARDIREAYAVRAELEGYAAELAAEWARDAQLHRLARAAGLFERLVESEVARPTQPVDHEQPSWQEANDRFHEAVLDAASNHRLATTIDDLHTSFPRNLTFSALSGHAGLLAENVDQHRRVLRAIETRDRAGARAAMVAHVLRAGELVGRRLDELSTETGEPRRI